MDAFGFYTVPEDKRLNLVDFLAVNLSGVCQTLCPEKIPAVVFTHDSLTPDTPDNARAVIRYTPELNMFMLHPEAIVEEFGSLLDDLTALFTGLWEAVFHEVRHFVQYQIFGESTHKDVLLNGVVLDAIAEQDTEVAQWAESSISVYALTTADKNAFAIEYDAIVVGIIAVSTFWKYCDGDSFDFDKVRRVLMSTMHEYRENPSLLNVF